MNSMLGRCLSSSQGDLLSFLKIVFWSLCVCVKFLSFLWIGFVLFIHIRVWFVVELRLFLNFDGSCFHIFIVCKSASFVL